MANTKAIVVTGKMLNKLTNAGVIVTEPSLPAHLAALINDRAEKMAAFDQYEITVDLSKYSDFHPIHALL